MIHIGPATFGQIFVLQLHVSYNNSVISLPLFGLDLRSRRSPEGLLHLRDQGTCIGGTEFYVSVLYLVKG